MTLAVKAKSFEKRESLTTSGQAKSANRDIKFKRPSAISLRCCHNSKDLLI